MAIPTPEHLNAQLLGGAARRPRRRRRALVRHRLGALRRAARAARCSATPLDEVLAARRARARRARGLSRSSATSTTCFPLGSGDAERPTSATCWPRSTTCSPLAGQGRGARLPALLRRRHPGRGAGRARRRLRRDPRAAARPVRRRGDRRLPDRPPRRPRRPRGLPGAAARRAPAAAWVVVEKILAPGRATPDSWACAGTTGYDAIARHPDRAGATDRARARRALARRLRRRDARRAVELARQARRSCTTCCAGGATGSPRVAESSALVGPEATRLLTARRVRRGVRRAARRTSSVYRAYLRLGVRRPTRSHCGASTRWSQRATAERPDLAEPARRDPLGCWPTARQRRPRRPRPRRPLPAGLRSGHGQGRRGHHVLPLAPLHRPERGRRRPRLPRRTRPGRALHDWAATRQEHHPHGMTTLVDARHQAQTRTSAPGCSPPPRTSMAWQRPVVAGARRAPRSTASTGRRPTCSSRPSSARGRSTSERLDGLPREGGPRGQAAHQLERPGRGVRRPRRSTSARACLSDAAAGGTASERAGRPRRRRSRRRRWRPRLLQLTLPGVPDVYQGSEWLTRTASSTPTTGGRSTTSVALAAAELDDRLTAAHGLDDDKLWVTSTRPAAAPRAPGAVRRRGDLSTASTSTSHADRLRAWRTASRRRSRAGRRASAARLGGCLDRAPHRAVDRRADRC